MENGTEIRTSDERRFPERVDAFFFRRGLGILADNKVFFLKLVVVTAVIAALLQLFFEHTVLYRFESAAGTGDVPGVRTLTAIVVFSLLLQFVNLLPQSYFTAVAVNKLPEMYEGSQVGFMESLSVNLPTFYLLFVYSLFVFLLQIVGTMMCIIPGILVLIHFVFLPYVIVLEKDVNIVSRCFSTVSGLRWDIVIVYLIFILIAGAMYLMTVVFEAAIPGGAPERMSAGYILLSFVYSFVFELLNFYFLILFFQLYMIARIGKGEIEIVNAD